MVEWDPNHILNYVEASKRTFMLICLVKLRQENNFFNCGQLRRLSFSVDPKSIIVIFYLNHNKYNTSTFLHYHFNIPSKHQYHYQAQIYYFQN